MPIQQMNANVFTQDLLQKHITKEWELIKKFPVLQQGYIELRKAQLVGVYYGFCFARGWAPSGNFIETLK